MDKKSFDVDSLTTIFHGSRFVARDTKMDKIHWKIRGIIEIFCVQNFRFVILKFHNISKYILTCKYEFFSSLVIRFLYTDISSIINLFLDSWKVRIRNNKREKMEKTKRRIVSIFPWRKIAAYLLRASNRNYVRRDCYRQTSHRYRARNEGAISNPFSNAAVNQERNCDPYREQTASPRTDWKTFVSVLPIPSIRTHGS